MSRACDFDEEPSLREQLARRFGALHGHNDDSPDIVKLHPVFLRCADECIRQMEWAHRMNSHKSTGCVCYCDAPVTLAPPDWKP